MYRDLEPLLHRLEEWLAKHRPRYLSGLQPGATAAALEAFQAALGLPVPGELKSLLAWRNGQGPDFAGRFEQDWNLLSIEGIAAAKRQLDASKACGTAWQSTWIPLLDDDADDYLCLDTSQPGNPVRQFWQDKTEHPIVAASLGGWLEEFVAALERGEYQEDPERGSLLRRRGGQ